MNNPYFRISSSPIKRKSPILYFFSSLSITGWLIFTNIFLFVLTIIINLFFKVNNYLALQPNLLFNDYYLWTLITSMFMHAGLFHLFVNMFSLFFIGKFLEKILGKQRYFWFYLIAGIFSGLFFASFSYFFGNSILGAKIFASPDTFAVGASGAIFAIAGVLSLITPKNKVYLISGPLIALIIQSILNNFGLSNGLLNLINLVITVYVFFCIFSLLSPFGVNKIALPIQLPFWLLPIVAIVPLIIIGLFISLPIGNMAHLGGYVFGAVYGMYLKLKYPQKTKLISKLFSK